MIIVRPESVTIDHEQFTKDVCIQVYGTWEVSYDEMGLIEGTLYGKTGSTQHGIPEAYREMLVRYQEDVERFRAAKRDLSAARDGSAKFASQRPWVHTVKSVFQVDGPSLVKYGNVWARRWWWKKGEGFPGHKHHFDHVSLLYRGSAKVTVEGVETTYSAPAEIIMSKDKVHHVQALEDNTVWMCVFACRDVEGEPDIFGESNDPASAS